MVNQPPNEPGRTTDLNYTPQTERPRFAVGGEPRQAVVPSPPGSAATDSTATISLPTTDAAEAVSPTLELTLSAPGFPARVVTARPSLADLAAGPDVIIDRYVRPALRALIHPPDAVITR